MTRSFLADPDQIFLFMYRDARGNIVHRTAKDVQRETGALVVVNANYFTPNYTDPKGRAPVGQVNLDGVNYAWPDEACFHFEAVTGRPQGLLQPLGTRRLRVGDEGRTKAG